MACPPTSKRLLLAPEAERTPRTNKLGCSTLLRFDRAGAGRRARAAIDKLREAMPQYPTTLVMRERPPENPRPTFVHNRGEFLQPTERVEPRRALVASACRRTRRTTGWRLARWLVA